MTPPKDATSRVLAEILDGRHDGKLFQIVEAITKRTQTDETGFLWRITLGDDVWDAETVTTGELRYVESVISKSYLEIDPSQSMVHFAALVVAHYKAQGMKLLDAVAKADSISQTEALAALSVYEGTLGKGSASTGS